MFGINKKNDDIHNYINESDYIDVHYLNNHNAIAVTKEGYFYKMCHLTQIYDGSIKERNSWYVTNYKRGIYLYDNTLEIKNIMKDYDGAYDIPHNDIIVYNDNWDSVHSTNRGANTRYEIPYVNYLKEYNGYLASIKIKSDYEEDDVYGYDNIITKEHIVKSFGVEDGPYFALLNLDGTIRGNKLFKGQSFSKIEEIIDLDEYESFEAFKEEKKKECNRLKQLQKEKDSDGSLSYKEIEVLKVLKLVR